MLMDREDKTVQDHHVSPGQTYLGYTFFISTSIFALGSGFLLILFLFPSSICLCKSHAAVAYLFLCVCVILLCIFYQLTLPTPPTEEGFLQLNSSHFSTFKFEMSKNIYFEHLNLGYPASVCL